MQNFAFSRLPELSTAEKQSLRNAFDFIGINHYSTFLTHDIKEADISDYGLAADSRTAVFSDPSWIQTGLNTNRVGNRCYLISIIIKKIIRLYHGAYAKHYDGLKKNTIILKFSLQRWGVPKLANL